MIAGAETKQKVFSVYVRIGDRLERHAGWVAALLLCLIFVIALGQSAIKPLWFDELVTFGTASLPGWGDIWNFYATGLDTSSPLPSLIVHAALKLPFGPETSSRLPFMLAFLVMCLCMYSFVRRRYPPGYALAALIFPVILYVFYYSTEARSYAFLLAGAGSAMPCWQSAVSGRSRPWSALGLWFGLALAINAHTFAIFLFVPFALAQLVRDFMCRKSDWVVWAAIVLFPAGLLPVLNGERLANKVYGSTFWSRPQLRFMVSSYKDFFILGWILIGILLFFAIGVAVLQRQRPLRSPEPATCGFSVPEWVLVAVLALMPLYALPASYLLHVYRPCYVIPFNIGMVILFIAAVAEAAGRNRPAGAALLALFLLAASPHCFGPFVKGLHALIHPGRVHAQLQASYHNQPWVRLLERSSLPVVAGDPLLYAQLDFYAQPELKHRLYYLTDIADLKEYPQAATPQLNYLLFGKRLSYQTMDIANFLPGNPHFLLAMGVNPGWLPPYLIGQEEAGDAALRLLGPGYTGNNVYDVRFTKMPVLACTD
jgi:hypothetical protein